MAKNRLANEKSPYLLQHAANPVDWYPWGEEAFQKARAEDKPIFLSIGYSTCHWCHVMERESFENESIAEILNRSYVAIKLDREERPDIDRVYMTFVQATTGSGGWPMSVWLTPELKPFYGGTYFPPETRWGTPGFASVLEQIASAWKSDRGRIEESARGVVERLREQGRLDAGQRRPGAPDPSLLDHGFQVFRRSFDSRTGGFGAAPKFPRPSVLNFLLRYHARTKNSEAREMVLLTLREMARGGMNDQLGGGFHRYSVDDRWFVPHFEKMLYDQAQLAISYVEAYQITGEDQYAETARRTLDYVLRDMTAPEGGFYSAEDADSVIDPAHPHEKGEGAFYIWAADEVEQVVGAPAAEWFLYRYGCEPEGNVAHDPHGEFAGRNILWQARTVEQTAQTFEAPVDEVRAAIEKAERALFDVRAKRVRPHLDDKVLTAWNGLMISALARAGSALGEGRYAEAARRAADFFRERMWDAGTRSLLRRYREGEVAIAGFLDDYAFLAQAMLDLYEAQAELRDLEMALALVEETAKRFGDPAGGGFWSSAEGDPSAIMRLKDDYDGAEPSGNSVAAMNLLRASGLTNNDSNWQQGLAVIAAFGQRLSLVPASLPQMLAACECVAGPRRQIVLVSGGAAAAEELRRAIGRRFLPHAAVIHVNSAESRAFFVERIEAVGPMQPIGARAAAYVCRDYACELPVASVEELERLLQ